MSSSFAATPFFFIAIIIIVIIVVIVRRAITVAIVIRPTLTVAIAIFIDALGGSMGRNVLLDMEGGGLLVAQMGLFWMGVEIPSSSELIVACVGGFSPPGVASLRFWRRSRTRM